MQEWNNTIRIFNEKSQINEFYIIEHNSQFDY